MGRGRWPVDWTRDVEAASPDARSSQPLSDEETLTAKLSLLNDLIVQDILMAKARELKIELPDTEVETATPTRRRTSPGTTSRR